MSSQFLDNEIIYQQSSIAQMDDTHRQTTPLRIIQTSHSKRSFRQNTSIPKYLQSELQRQGQKETFMTEISCNSDKNNQTNTSFFFNQNNYSARNISTAASSSFRTKILRSRKPVDFAIKTFQNSSLRLESFFNSMQNQNAKNKQDDDLSELENCRQKAISIPKNPTKNIEHGFVRKDTMKKSKTQMNLVQTLSHIPHLLDELDQMEKQQVYPEEVELLRNESRLRKVVKKIDYSKQVSQITPVLQLKVYESRQQDNSLNFKLLKSTSKLHLLKQQQNKICNPLITAEINSLKLQIKDLEKQIEEYQHQIDCQEMHLISKLHMKRVRYQDVNLKKIENINLLKITSHLNRFLQRETNLLIQDSKNIDQLFRKMVEERYNKEEYQNRQSVMTRDMENKKFNESEADRLIDLEMKMRDYERKDIQKKKRQEYLELKAIQNQDLENIMCQQNQYKNIIYNLDSQFAQFHSQNSIASSYSDLLQFCIHVKQNTVNLNHEKIELQEKAEILKQEVQELEDELRQKQLQNSFDFEIENITESVMQKKDYILNQGQSNQNNINQKKNKSNYPIQTLDQIENENFEVNKYSQTTKNQQNLTSSIVFKSLNGLKDLHNLFFTKLNNIPFDDLIKLKKKQFNIDQLESSIQHFSNSIKHLISIINGKTKEQKHKTDQSLDIEEISETSENEEKQKYYYTYAEL